MSWENLDFEGYLIKKIKQIDNLHPNIDGVTESNEANDFYPDSESGSDAEEQ
jgi:hypothetical protein